MSVANLRNITGSASTSLGITVVDLVIDPASVAISTSAEQTFTLAGLKTSDFVMVGKPALTAGLGISHARVSAPDTLAITFINSTAGAVDAGSETWRVLVIRTT